MPTYEYECRACRNRLERFQYLKERPLRTCPKCRRSTLRRLISGGGGLLFKGSGFYITDYRSPEYREKEKADSGTPSSDLPAPTSVGAQAGTASGAPKKESKTAEVGSPPAGGQVASPAHGTKTKDQRKEGRRCAS